MELDQQYELMEQYHIKLMDEMYIEFGFNHEEQQLAFERYLSEGGLSDTLADKKR